METLKAICGCICGIVTCLIVLLFVETYTYISKQPKAAQQTESVGSVQIIGNDNVIVVNSNETSSRIQDYSTIILTAREDDYGLNLKDASKLLDKIKKYSTKYNIPLKEALLIVHVESDFKASAYNKNGEAYGLCQVTKPCLNEYNWKNGTNYTLEQMLNPDLNLEVGFWYYNRILTHYSDYYGYITTTTEETRLRDAYICYNVGVTVFDKIGWNGRHSLRTGTYPSDMYGSKKGDVYEPMNRFNKLAKIWL